MTKQSQDLIERCNMKKRGNVQLRQYIGGFVPERTLEAITSCADWVYLVADRSMKQKKVLYATFCKNRFCPFCSWRKACKDAMRLTAIMDYVRYKLKKEIVFLTLTAPNIPAAGLQKEIDKYNDSFKKLLKRDEVLRVVKGYIRKLEVTYNEERNDYHPHFHVLLAVNKSYFTDRTYISHERWLELWQEVTGDNTITQVDARKFRGADVRELAKYAAKDSDYLLSQEVFNVFYGAIKGRRVSTYGGIFNDANKLYKAHELDYIRELNLDTVEYVYKMLYQWGVKEYGLSRLTELTEDERREIMKRAIEDVDEDE